MSKTILILLLILSSCSSIEEEKTPSKNNLIEVLSNADIKGFSRVEKVIEFEFPRDHYAHKDFKSEWWYFTGNLEDKTGRKFGYQFTIFRHSVYPSKETIPNNSKWKTNQIYMGHLGLTDKETNKFYSYEISEREAISLAGIQTKPFKLWLDNWSLESSSETTFPLRIKAARDGVAINLELNPSKVITLQGDRGLSQKSPELGNASYYYSITRLDTQGSIKIKDKEYTVQGDSWMDREWSTSSLSTEQEGWDWFALQFSDNTELMYYQLRNKDGSISVTSSGSFVDKDSKRTSIKNQDIELKVLSYWKSEDHNYPAKWSLKIPSQNIDIVIEPLIKNQEHKFYIPYWEGAVTITGKNKSGRGYVELTGY